MHIIALYIILGIILLIALVLCLRANLRIIYENDLLIYLKILCFKFYIYPEKNKKFDIKKYKKKQKKKQNTTKTVLKERNEYDKKPTLLDKLSLIREVLSVFLKSFTKHLRIKIAKMHITVGSPDAAQTAIMYGAISGTVAGIVELIDSYTNLNGLKDDSIAVVPDFTVEKCEVNIDISLSISVLGALITLAKTFWRYTVLKNKK